LTQQIVLDYLGDLRQNNNKQWFEANRERYQMARTAFEDLIAELIMRFESVDDLHGTTPKDCMFRINRDVRFSKDKSPYNTHMSAVLAQGGRKSQSRSYYLQIAPGDSMVAGGLHSPTSQALEKVRRRIAEDAAPLRKILAAPGFVKYFGTLQGDTLKTAPSGYDKANPNIDLLRHKQFMAVHHLDDQAVAANDLIKHIIDVCGAMKPFVSYLQDNIG
jgi:uncharacterized protein (TIGR02453 family)